MQQPNNRIFVIKIVHKLFQKRIVNSEIQLTNKNKQV